MSKVFISHSHVDNAAAAKLAVALQACGLEVWWDKDGLDAGDEWRDRIKTQLDAAQAVVVIWSTNSAKSHWVREEASRAQQAGKLISTLVEGAKAADVVPMGFGELHHVGVLETDRIVRGVNRLDPPTAQPETQKGAVNAPPPPGPPVLRWLLVAVVVLAVIGLAALGAVALRDRGGGEPTPEPPHTAVATRPATPEPTYSPDSTQASSPRRCAAAPLLGKLIADDFGRVRIAFDRSCGELASVRVNYHNFVFLRPLAAVGDDLVADFPLFAGPEEITLSVDGAPELRLPPPRPQTSPLEMTAIVWTGAAGLELHMAEFGVRADSASDKNVFAGNPHSAERARNGETGWLMVADNGSGEGAHMQVYAFSPTERTPSPGVIQASVGVAASAEPGRLACGADVAFQMIRFSASRGSGGVVQARGHKLDACGSPSGRGAQHFPDGDIRP